MRAILGYLAPSQGASLAVLGVVWFGLVGLVGAAGKYNEKCKFYEGKATVFAESDQKRGAARRARADREEPREPGAGRPRRTNRRGARSPAERQSPETGIWVLKISHAAEPLRSANFAATASVMVNLWNANIADVT